MRHHPRSHLLARRPGPGRRRSADPLRRRARHAQGRRAARRPHRRADQPNPPAGRPADHLPRPAGRSRPGRGRQDAGRQEQPQLWCSSTRLRARSGNRWPCSNLGDPKPGFSVVGLVVRGDRVYASDAQGLVRVAERRPDGKYAFAGKHVETIKPRVGGLAHPAGMALLPGDEMMVTSTRGNSVQVVNLASGQVEQVVGVGVAPFTVLPVGPGRVYVTNWGGDAPAEGDPPGRHLRHARPHRPAHRRRQPRQRLGRRGRARQVEAGQDHRGRPAPLRHGRQPARPLRLRRQRQQRHRLGHRHAAATRSSKRSPAGPRGGCRSAAVPTPWP